MIHIRLEEQNCRALQSLIVARALLSITLNFFLLYVAAAIQSQHGRRH